MYIDHVNGQLQFVSKDYNATLVCSTCISTTHSGHKGVAIRLIVQEEVPKMFTLPFRIQKNIKFLRKLKPQNKKPRKRNKEFVFSRRKSLTMEII